MCHQGKTLTSTERRDLLYMARPLPHSIAVWYITKSIVAELICEMLVPTSCQSKSQTPLLSTAPLIVILTGTF